MSPSQTWYPIACVDTIIILGEVLEIHVAPTSLIKNTILSLVSPSHCHPGPLGVPVYTDSQQLFYLPSPSCVSCFFEFLNPHYSRKHLVEVNCQYQFPYPEYFSCHVARDLLYLQWDSTESTTMNLCMVEMKHIFQWVQWWRDPDCLFRMLCVNCM